MKVDKPEQTPSPGPAFSKHGNGTFSLNSTNSLLPNPKTKLSGANMTFDFQNHVLGLSVFENYFQCEKVLVAVKKNNVVFTAMANVVKAAPISPKTKFYKIIKLAGPETDVKTLLLCPSQRYLTVVGEKSISVVDTNEISFADHSTALAEPFSFDLGKFKDPVQCVQWHPAAARHSEIVVLTSRQILVFDVMCSFSTPVLVLDLASFPDLDGKNVVSMAFGSADSFSGSITLYINTACGLIYAIFPFLCKGSLFRTSALQISQFYLETQEALSSVSDSFPPIVINKNPRVEALASQLSFAESLQQNLTVSMGKELAISGDVTLDYAEPSFGYEIQGPVAKTGKNATIVQVASNDKVSLLASVHSTATGNSKIEYYGQFQPLVMGMKKIQDNFHKPTEPQSKVVVPKEESYVKPARGFGYVVESDSDDEDNSAFEAAMKAYHEELEIYNLNVKLSKHFSDNFGNLTKMASDSTKISGNPIISSEGEKLLLASGGTLLVGSLGESTASLFLSLAGLFEPTYDTFDISPDTTSVALCEDTIGHSGSFVISCSPKDKVYVRQIVSNEVKITKKEAPEEFLPTPPVPSYVPADELRLRLDKSLSIGELKNFNLESIDTLSDVHGITRNAAGQINALTKFMLSLQMKLKFQVEDLRAQVKDAEHALAKYQNEEKRNSTERKLSLLVGRQQKLAQKQKRIQENIVDRFEELKLKIDLPISKAEREWFKELNDMNQSVNVDGTSKSISTLVEEITREVASLTTEEHEREEQEREEPALELLQMGPALSRIRNFLLYEEKLIRETKTKAQQVASSFA